MDIIGAESTDLFIGSDAAPRQVVRVVLRGSGAPARTPGAPVSGSGAPASTPARVSIRGSRLRTDEPLMLGPLGPGEEARLEVGVAVDGDIVAGELVDAEVVVEGGPVEGRHPFQFALAEPGWRMFMISHFHYDPVWWNTQAAYTETWGAAIQYRSPFQEPGLALVKAHLEMARRDPDYKFVLAELDYLKPYWDAYPEDRGYVRQLLAEDRLEFVGGTYNEPNTNLTSAESTIRNAIYGIGYQRDVLGGDPATAWQLDAFGHDPQFPGIMADAGVSSSSWARGPFHEWGPNWVRGPGRLPFAELAAGERPRMQFPMEFDWIAPSGRALLTSFMADHYSAGWWMDAAPTLAEAEAEVHRLFSELAPLAATKNVLLPVGTDYTPPNKWLTAIHRDWNRRYVWPKFITAIPREFFAAVRAEQAKTNRPFSPQTRDMNPIYTGKDVSFIDTKQAQRIAENTLLAAEKFASIAGLLGARFPTEAIDKAWRQLLFGAHHDGITGSESDQVYLDLLGGWREAVELGSTVLEGALDQLGAAIDTTGEGRAVTVFNALSWPRTDVVRVAIDLAADHAPGIELSDDSGARVPLLLEATDRREDRAASRATIAFIARDVPAFGFRTYRLGPSTKPLDESGWHAIDTLAIDNQTYAVAVDPARGGAISSIVDKRSGKELVRGGGVANELRAYREYPNHPLFAEGPWHLTPDGRFASAIDYEAEVTVEASPIGRRIRVEGSFDESRRSQEIRLWDGVERIDLNTSVHDYRGHDRLFRVRFPADVEGGTPVSEVGNAVVGRPFGRPNVDVAVVPFTLDHPAYNWFALSTTARIALGAAGARQGDVRASRAIAVAEVVVPDDPRQDQAVRSLVISLVRRGVTSTVSRHDGGRYGVLHIDSNLPDVRLAVGGPDENRFVAAVLDAADPGYRSEVERQLAGGGRARVWVPEDGDAPGRDEPITDLRGVRALPVLIVAGADAEATTQALDELVSDLDDGTIVVDQPAELDRGTGRTEDYTVAVLNHGIPGFNVEADGSMYLSLMRSCSGWPSGVWIDPPRRATPDGANFQFQHWTHSFDYALASAGGDWREAGIVRAGHDYNNPLIARVLEAHGGPLPATTSLVEVEPASVVMTVLKPGGVPQARMAGMELDPAAGLALRLYESSGRATEATIRSRWPIVAAAVTNALEEEGRALSPSGTTLVVSLQPYEIATIAATVDAPTGEGRTATELASRGEIAQPTFSDYWLHNKGAAPMGYQAVTVQIKPSVLTGDGPFQLPIVVASERTDEAAAGSVALIVPPGWEATPTERIYRLAPGAHLAFEASVRPAAGAAPGRYFVAARITDDAGQLHEDIVTIDHRPGGDGIGSPSPHEDRSGALAWAVERALTTAGIGPGPDASTNAGARHDPGGELRVELLDADISAAPGDHESLRVSLRNLAASEIRGEAQILSPLETWSSITPWTQGFSVGPGEEAILEFSVAPPPDAVAGTYWALVKVMYFGRLLYSESVPVVIPASQAAGVLHLAERAGVQSRTGGIR
jgi:alpha-mannosidase